MSGLDGVIGADHAPESRRRAAAWAGGAGRDDVQRRPEREDGVWGRVSSRGGSVARGSTRVARPRARVRVRPQRRGEVGEQLTGLGADRCGLLSRPYGVTGNHARHDGTSPSVRPGARVGRGFHRGGWRRGGRIDDGGRSARRGLWPPVRRDSRCRRGWACLARMFASRRLVRRVARSLGEGRLGVGLRFARGVGLRFGRRVGLRLRVGGGVGRRGRGGVGRRGRGGVGRRGRGGVGRRGGVRPRRRVGLRRRVGVGVGLRLRFGGRRRSWHLTRLSAQTLRPHRDRRADTTDHREGGGYRERHGSMQQRPLLTFNEARRGCDKCRRAMLYHLPRRAPAKAGTYGRSDY
jgi:hypothetical protein